MENYLGSTVSKSSAAPAEKTSPKGRKSPDDVIMTNDGEHLREDALDALKRKLRRLHGVSMICRTEKADLIEKRSSLYGPNIVALDLFLRQ
jgi:hypothetical protein